MHEDGYGRQNRAAYDAMMGMMGEYDEYPADEALGTPPGETAPVANAGDMQLGQEGQDTPPDGGGMSEMYSGGYDGNDPRRRAGY